MTTYGIAVQVGRKRGRVSRLLRVLFVLLVSTLETTTSTSVVTASTIDQSIPVPKSISYDTQAAYYFRELGISFAGLGHGKFMFEVKTFAPLKARLTKLKKTVDELGLYEKALKDFEFSYYNGVREQLEDTFNGITRFFGLYFDGRTEEDLKKEQECKYILETQQVVCPLDEKVSVQKSRKKRIVVTTAIALGILAGGVAAAGIAGTVTGSMSLSQLKDARTDFQALSQKTEEISQRVDNVILVSSRNGLLIDAINNEVQALDNIVKEFKASIRLDREIREIERQLDRFEKLVLHLQNNRIYPGLFRGNQAEELLSELQSQAREQGYDLLLNQEDVFVQSEALFIRNQNLQEVTVVMLVPIARSRNVIKLHYYRPMPMYFREYPNTAFEIDVGKRDVLAIMSNADGNEEKEMFATTSYASLKTDCEKQGEKYFCHHLNVFRRASSIKEGENHSDICLYKLYKRDYSSINSTCSMKAVVESDSVKQISATKFVMHTRRSQQGRTYCQNGKLMSTPYTLSLLQMLTMRHGCFHRSANYLVISPYQFVSNKTFQEYIAPHEITNMLIGKDTLSGETKPTVLVEKHQEYQKALDKINAWARALLNGESLDKNNDDVGESRGSGGLIPGIPDLGISLGSILLLALVIAIVVHCFRTKQSATDAKLSKTDHELLRANWRSARARTLAVQARTGTVVMSEVMRNAGLVVDLENAAARKAAQKVKKVDHDDDDDGDDDENEDLALEGDDDCFDEMEFEKELKRRRSGLQQ